MTKLAWPFLLALLFLPRLASAYPGMIRDGYVNCTSCHVSPSGGGVLNSYGRGLSSDLLSTWGKEGEGAFLYGAFANKLPDALLLGGDTRLIGTYMDNPQYKEKRLFLMQSDLEAAYSVGKFTLDVEAGYLDSGDFQSLRHYAMFHFDEQNTLRLGKFRNNYGINFDEHTITVKDGLGFGDETETYNLEYSRLTDSYSLFVTAIAGAPEPLENRSGLTIGTHGMVDHGGSVRASKFIADKYEIGASYLYGHKTDGPWRSVMGPYAILGFTPHFYYMGELDFQEEGGWRLFDYQRLTYEVVQGLHLFLTQEVAQSDGGPVFDRVERYGAGIQFFPRPHFEVDFRWHWEKNLFGENSFHPFAWLLLHLYL